MSKGSNRSRCGLRLETDVALLRPRLLPLSDEQKAEAVVLLSGLLLAAARRSANGRNASTHVVEGSPSRRNSSAGEFAREGLAA